MVCRSYPDAVGSKTTISFSGPSTAVYSQDGGKECLVISANGYPINHPFEVDRTKNTPVTANGFLLTQPSQPSHGSQYNACPIGSFTSNVIARKSYPALPSGSAMAARLLAGTNPTRPAIRLPVALFELRELPMMYHQALTFLTAGRRGDRHGKYWKRLSPTQRLASANLATQFGLLPMLRDVKTLFQMPDAVAKRQKEWDRLYSSGGLKRRMTLHKGESTDTRTYTHFGGYGLLAAKCNGTINSWGTVRWKPTNPSPNFGRPTDPEVKRMLLGLTAGDIPANLWNALPWSWLVDWFTNAGDILQANQGRGHAYPTSLCVMHHRTAEWRGEPYTLETYAGNRKETVVASAGCCLHESKLRILPSATLSAELPLLTGGTLSILGSLAVSRGRFSSRINPGAPRWRPGSLR